jgi:hypothetical protein
MQNNRFFLLDLKTLQTKRTLRPLSNCTKFRRRMSRFPACRCIKEYKTILFRKKKPSQRQPSRRHGNFHPTSAQTITTFDAPGVGTAPAGLEHWFKRRGDRIFFDPNNVVHGFVREADAGALGLPKFYRTVTPGRPMPLRKRHSLPEIIAHERLRPALTPAEV